ncbi:diguanylate cyclase [Marinobacter nanhaiticus D15-8W]|uniref:diguanylate cyclase n=1 Tax=Marinobacter nanhaiticus D15-8W TaxID=626887 RepID=N6W0V1_9GAMM|nr:diguanylate cyclase [Marinobacter nanhaiticus]ENO13709.2 diguanylate cyclase [Marinobacter nanhaiticus D15-8W]
MLHSNKLFRADAVRSVVWTLLLLVGFLSVSNAFAQAETCPELMINDPQARADIYHHLCFFTERGTSPKDASISSVEAPEDLVENAQWELGDGRELAFAQTDASYWLRLDVHNSGPKAGYWFLTLDYAPLDNVTVWVGTTGNYRRIETGDRRPFATRQVDYRYYLVPVMLESGESSRIFLHISSSGAINLPLSLEEPTRLVAATNQLTLTHGLFYGGLMMFALFNLLLFFSTGTAYYFYNAFYMLATGLFLFSMGGFSFQYLFPGAPWLANMAIPLSEGLSILAFTLFGRSFLDIDANQPRLSGLLKALAALSVLITALCFVLPYAVIIKVATLYGLACIVTLFCIGIQRWRQGYSPAKWYVLAWSTMAIGTCIYALAAFGYLSDFLAREILMQIAVGAQILLLNYAMVQRWRLLNEKLLAMETAAKHELEVRVSERTAQLQETMRQLESANRRLEQISTQDALTDLNNRRYLDESLPKACAEGRRTRQPIALILLDADRFKSINDTFGHPFGDECLKHIAATLVHHIQRPSDVVVRYGGEEFAVVLPKTDGVGALKVTERILDDMRSKPIVAPDGTSVHLTLSAGIAVYHNDESPDGFVRRADKALYAAKQAGRDRVILGQAPAR